MTFSHEVVSELLCSPMDYSPSVFSVHRISQARKQEWVAISFSRGSSWPRDRTVISCIGRQILYNWATWEAPHRYATHHLTSCLCKKLYLNTVAKMKGFPILTWNEVLKASALLPGVHVISFSNRVRACPAREWMKRQTRGKLLTQLSGIYLDTSHKISSYPSAYILNCVPSYSLLSNYLLRMYKDNTSFQGTGSTTVNRIGVILEGGRY